MMIHYFPRRDVRCVRMGNVTNLHLFLTETQATNVRVGISI